MAPSFIFRRATRHFILGMTRQQKITFGEMRASGVRNVLIYCTDYRCSHCIMVPDDPDRWSDELRMSDIEDRFACTACGKRGADIRPDWRTVERPHGKLHEMRERYMKELSANPKWRDTTKSGGGSLGPRPPASASRMDD